MEVCFKPFYIIIQNMKNWLQSKKRISLNDDEIEKLLEREIKNDNEIN